VEVLIQTKKASLLWESVALVHDATIARVASRSADRDLTGVAG
jgi:hypothetical protein